ncbi:TOBE domain-containing protein [Cellulomonas composti]|uniref:Molybdenum-pterin-binding protein n=1 Tax=Cellulomonas composti TaxID=266130 RepID=A0A511J7S4_9CELL|nr:TOBE domain-containing protein [Cellulomonas composti]GEL94047.1 molybdenum-pterin-binding protein [Cellulomonas composti]
MQLSARNQLAGTVRSVQVGAVMAEVVVDIGGNDIVAAITAGSVASLGLAEGEKVVVVVKATEVMIGRE